MSLSADQDGDAVSDLDRVLALKASRFVAPSPNALPDLDPLSNPIRLPKKLPSATEVSAPQQAMGGGKAPVPAASYPAQASLPAAAAGDKRASRRRKKTAEVSVLKGSGSSLPPADLRRPDFGSRVEMVPGVPAASGAATAVDDPLDSQFAGDLKRAIQLSLAEFSSKLDPDPDLDRAIRNSLQDASVSDSNLGASSIERDDSTQAVESLDGSASDRKNPGVDGEFGAPATLLNDLSETYIGLETVIADDEPVPPRLSVPEPVRVQSPVVETNSPADVIQQSVQPPSDPASFQAGTQLSLVEENTPPPTEAILESSDTSHSMPPHLFPHFTRGPAPHVVGYAHARPLLMMHPPRFLHPVSFGFFPPDLVRWRTINMQLATLSNQLAVARGAAQWSQDRAAAMGAQLEALSSQVDFLSGEQYRLNAELLMLRQSQAQAVAPIAAEGLEPKSEPDGSVPVTAAAAAPPDGVDRQVLQKMRELAALPGISASAEPGIKPPDPADLPMPSFLTGPGTDIKDQVKPANPFDPHTCAPNISAQKSRASSLQAIRLARMLGRLVRVLDSPALVTMEEIGRVVDGQSSLQAWLKTNVPPDELVRSLLSKIESIAPLHEERLGYILRLLASMRTPENMDTEFGKILQACCDAIVKKLGSEKPCSSVSLFYLRCLVMRDSAINIGDKQLFDDAYAQGWRLESPGLSSLSKLQSLGWSPPSLGRPASTELGLSCDELIPFLSALWQMKVFGDLFQSKRPSDIDVLSSNPDLLRLRPLFDCRAALQSAVAAEPVELVIEIDGVRYRVPSNLLRQSTGAQQSFRCDMPVMVWPATGSLSIDTISLVLKEGYPRDNVRRFTCERHTKPLPVSSERPEGVVTEPKLRILQRSGSAAFFAPSEARVSANPPYSMIQARIPLSEIVHVATKDQSRHYSFRAMGLQINLEEGLENYRLELPSKCPFDPLGSGGVSLVIVVAEQAADRFFLCREGLEPIRVILSSRDSVPVNQITYQGVMICGSQQKPVAAMKA